ncbi:MAG TPA: MHYT domain-containing protein [Candidatus Angelobacter sp.]|jgi:NO-binding membrane sensor protein with MHYT domain
MGEFTTLHSTYDYPLVVLSVLIAIAASYAALTLAARVSMARNQARTAWLFGGAIAMGTGIWSMHYTGMVAYRLPIQVYCHVPTVVLSLLAAIAASFVALFTVSRPKMNVFHVVAGSLLMAAGISAMHYVGMASMRLSAMHHYDNDMVLGSIAIAWMVSLVALGLIKMNLVLDSTNGESSTTSQPKVEKSSKLLKAVASVTMGIAIPIMHYTGMTAVSYQAMPGSPDLSFSMEISALGYTAIFIISVVMLVSTCLLSWWPTLMESPSELYAKDGAANK